MLAEVRKSIDRALEYLASKQDSTIGCWHENNQAVNALAILAFLGRGEVPGRGPYREVIERGKKFILATPSRVPGYLSYRTMYEHGLATLALAEMYGMDADPKLEQRLRQAVDLIIRVQSAHGGWNYAPSPGDGDLSISVMQIVALRAAMNAEIPVPASTIDKAIAYLRAHADPAGGFGYTGPGQGPHTTAAGILSMQLLGRPDDPEVKKSLPRLELVPIQWGPGPAYFYYFHYYAIQAKYQGGGTAWDSWHPRIRQLLLQHQNNDGSWDMVPGSAEHEGIVGQNKVYWSAMASLVLEIYLHFLPAYQR
jgi:hypothetical protein